ncbi:conserved membrane hypothetical protein [Syntrophobacter sp. SbD1]|nr:conserved membrane hypothetical protein [Syntrophobacter sp. SbD1]
MFHGLRRYETLHRLWWFVFFFLCLIFARFSSGIAYPPRQGPDLKDLSKIVFWSDLQGISITSPENSRGKQDQQDKTAQTGRSTVPDRSKQPAGPAAQNDYRENIELVSRILLFIIRAGMIFLELRLLWLVVQYAGRYLLQLFMSEGNERGSFNRGQEGKQFTISSRQGALTPFAALTARTMRTPLTFILHPFIRLRLILSGFQKNLSSEELLEKERRVVEADWSILHGSWGPYRCLVWVIPLLGLAQTVLLLIAQFNTASAGLALIAQKEAFEAAKPMLSTPKEIIESIKPTFSLLLPLIQAAGIAVFFQVAATLLRYFEELYLSNLDSFIYDQLLSKLPLRSSDTLLIMETLQQQYKDLNASLKRLENKLLSPPQGEK